MKKTLLTLSLLLSLGLAGCGPEFWPPFLSNMGKNPGRKQEHLAGGAPGVQAPMPQFTEVLAKEYDTLSAQQFAQQDWDEATYFSQKAGSLRAGIPVYPESLQARALAVQNNPELRTAFVMLSRHLNPQKIAQDPVNVAKAQAAFDCWVEAAEESVVEATRGECRNQFIRLNRTLDSNSGLPQVYDARQQVMMQQQMQQQMVTPPRGYKPSLTVNE